MADPVVDLLAKQGIPYNISGKDYLIRCLNTEHNDSNPSCRVDKVSGIAHCFSCGWKGNLFKFFGIFTNNTPIKVAKLKEKIAALKASTDGLDVLEGSAPWLTTYRNISVATLKTFGAFQTSKIEKLLDRIVFPIKDITGKTVVYVGRHTLSNAGVRYLNYPSGVEMPIFPASVQKGSKTLVLVEGLFDMLKCYDYGMRNVVSTFGTNTLQKDLKIKMLPYKAQGVEKIFILFDGDEAGAKAAKFLQPLLEEESFLVEIITLPDGVDPGDMSREDALSILEYTK